MDKTFNPTENSFRLPWIRNFLLAISDAMAIFLSGIVINGLMDLCCGAFIFSNTTLVFFCLAFVIIAEKTKLYHGSFFSPGLPLAPQEELRRIFYILLALLTVRLFYFPEFPPLIPYGEHLGFSDRFFKGLMVYSFFPLFFFLVIVLRWVARTIMMNLNIGIVPVAIWGAGGTGKLIVDILNKSRYHCMKPALIIDDDETKTGKKLSGIPIFGNLATVKNSGINHIIICVPFVHLLEKLRQVGDSFKYVSIVGATHNFPNYGSYLHDLYGITVVECKSGLKVPVNLLLRYILNMAITFCALSVFFPLMLIIAILIKISSRGPIFYVADRLGKNGCPVRILKFRTMYFDAEESLETLLENNPGLKDEWNHSFKLKDDPRVTPLGRLLRKTSLDELPQLISVLKGELNLIGPRPIVEEEVKYFGDDYNLIYGVTPGITGMWQVSGRSNTSYEERVLLDKYYVMNWSPWLDLYILIKTVLEVILCRGAY